MSIRYSSGHKCSTRTASKIEDFLYLSGYTSVIERHIKYNVVLTVMEEAIPQPNRVSGVDYHYIDAYDVDDEDLLSHFCRTNALIGQCQTSGRNILVHCRGGMSRSATVVIAYIMAKYNMSKDRAILYVRQKRPIIGPKEGFLRQLDLFEDMAFKLDANDRRFRNYLVEVLVKLYNNCNYINRYFERLSEIEKLSSIVEKGRQYCRQLRSFSVQSNKYR